MVTHNTYYVGDFGSKFYIILKGSVSVQIPVKHSQTDLQQASSTKTENSPNKKGTSSKKSLDETTP